MSRRSSRLHSRNINYGKDQIVDLTSDQEAIDLTSDNEGEISTNDHGILNMIAGNPITRYHVGILRGGEWLNDEIINSYLHTLCLERKDAYALSTYFYTKVCAEGGLTETIKRWLRPVGRISRWRIVLIPINLNNSHWALVAYNVVVREASYYDSMMSKSTGNKVLQRLLPALEHLHFVDDQQDDEEKVMPEKKEEPTGLLAYMMTKLNIGATESHDTPNELHELNSEAVNPIRLTIPERQPRQLDGSSCGVFVCKWSQMLVSSNSATFTQAQVTKHRQVILDTLLTFKEPEHE